MALELSGLDWVRLGFTSYDVLSGCLNSLNISMN
jgi:hypothetical protein